MQWWRTAIIDIHPGSIGIRGFPIQELIGKLSFVEMIWLMVRGEVASPAHARLLEAALVASVDHGPHAPSISIARMAVTCGVDLNNAMASGINVLGDVHGGPATAVHASCTSSLRTSRSMAGRSPARRITCWTRSSRQRGKSFRASVIAFTRSIPASRRCSPGQERAAARHGERAATRAIGREVEAALRRRTGKPIPMNIDGVTAVIFCELGFPPEMGRGLFILSRSVGILSHAWEQMQRKERIKGPMPKEIDYTYDGPAPRTLPPR